ncbi:hypothetical protein [Cupriavidus sp. IDO]|uniref:hypothetical protein n=1 Tax=Cupriavidus sp. IDO TaxID=1539142 RepID=UPI00057915BA|nr:hypothetical protein [Cupriavidus sp. IDO]KWR83372.1 hypothetical protein RM96_28330 [Cupriavidus sp. IDO]
MKGIACVALLVTALSGCGGTATSTPKKSYRVGNSCVMLDQSKIKDMAVLANHCSFRVFVKWFDQGYCTTGCGAGPISPGRSEGITLKKGSVEWAACESPGSIKGGDGSPIWNGGNFRCED